MNFKVVPKQKNVMKYFWVTFRRPTFTLKINSFVEVKFSISRVAAYEEFHGTGKRFKMMSNEVIDINLNVTRANDWFC